SADECVPTSRSVVFLSPRRCARLCLCVGSDPCAFSLFFFFIFRRPPRFTLFPYTTLFRSPKLTFGIPTSLAGVLPSSGLCVVGRSEEHTSELQSPYDLVCRLLLEKKKNNAAWTAGRDGSTLQTGSLRRHAQACGVRLCGQG